MRGQRGFFLTAMQPCVVCLAFLLSATLWKRIVFGASSRIASRSRGPPNAQGNKSIQILKQEMIAQWKGIHQIFFSAATASLGPRRDARPGLSS